MFQSFFEARRWQIFLSLLWFIVSASYNRVTYPLRDTPRRYSRVMRTFWEWAIKGPTLWSQTVSKVFYVKDLEVPFPGKHARFAFVAASYYLCFATARTARHFRYSSTRKYRFQDKKWKFVWERAWKCILNAWKYMVKYVLLILFY